MLHGPLPPRNLYQDIDNLCAAILVLLGSLRSVRAEVQQLREQVQQATEIAAATAAPVYGCPADAQVRQCMFVAGLGLLGIADATDPAKMPAVGLIKSKPSPTTCTIADAGDLDGFVALPAGRVFVGVAGGLAAAPPAAGVEQQAGFSLSGQRLKISLGVSPEVGVR